MKARFTKNIEISESIEGADLADMFWGMSSDHQAWFFNRLGDKRNLAMQLQYVTDQPDGLTQDGRNAMELIGGYSSKS